jgi:hypothetical protein
MGVLENVQKTEHKSDKCEIFRNAQCDHLQKSGHLASKRVRFGTEDWLKDWPVQIDMELNTFWNTMDSSLLFEYGMKQRNG